MWPPPPLQADLTITSFKAAVSGSTVTYTVETCNKGQAASGNFFVDVYYDRTTAPGLQELGDQYNNYSGGLAPAACNTTVLIRSNTPPGSYASWAQVDADGIVFETNESNNTAGPLNVTVAGPPPPKGADLVIQNMEVKVYGYASTTVRYRLTICNNGSDASTGTDVHVYYDRSSPPGVGQSGDKMTSIPGLQPGGCTTRNIFRTGTPHGSYSSWAQVDPGNQVAETDETNNVFGPVKVTVGTTPGADLTIKSFTYNVYGSSTVRYQVQVCNVGAGVAGTTQVHVYFNRSTAPKQGDLGDQYTYVTTLQPGSCSNRNIYRSGTPAATYTSWAQVDPSNQVAETDETNNTAGPLSVAVGSTTSCSAICAFAISCGMFLPSELQQCLTWCNVLSTSARQCVSAAVQNKSCADLKSCNTPPPPPPPPPPGVCPDLCSYLIYTCNLFPSNQYWTCIGACQNLTPDKIQCAQDAKNKSQCMQVVLCMF